MQSRGDVEEGVRLIEKALEMDELCEFAYETLGTIGKRSLMIVTYSQVM